MIQKESGPIFGFTLQLYLIQATALWYLPDSRTSPTATLKTEPVTSQNISLFCWLTNSYSPDTLYWPSHHTSIAPYGKPLSTAIYKAILLLRQKIRNLQEGKQRNSVFISHSSQFLAAGDLHPISITTQYVNFKELNNRGAEEDTSD